MQARRLLMRAARGRLATRPLDALQALSASAAVRRLLPQQLLAAMAVHWGYASVQGYIAFFRQALLYDWFGNGQGLQGLLSISVRPR